MNGITRDYYVISESENESSELEPEEINSKYSPSKIVCHSCCCGEEQRVYSTDGEVQRFENSPTKVYQNAAW